MSSVGSFLALPAALPITLAAAILASAFLLLAARRSARRRDELISPALAARLGLPARPGAWRLLLLVAFVVLGIGLALARPRFGKRAENVERRGSDVVILLDTSASMRAADVSPSRFVLARQAASSLLSRLSGDRVALVACEGEAQVLVPLTLDSAAVGLFLDALEPGIGAKPGTSLAAGLAAALELFPAGSPAGRTCVLISDGEDLEGGLAETIEKARSEGIVIHSVFVGAASGRGAPVPELDVAGRVTGYKSHEGSPVLSQPNPDLLRQLAAKTKGSYSVVSPGRTDLDGVSEEIDRAARRPLSQAMVTNLEERFQIPLGVAVVSLGLLILNAHQARFGRRGSPTPGRSRSAVAAAVLLLAASGRADAQAQGQDAAPPEPPAAAPEAPTPRPSGLNAAAIPLAAAPAAPPAPASPASPTPLPTPASLLRRVAGRPPFTTARSEARKGKQALEAQKPEEALPYFARQKELRPDDPTGDYNLGSALSKAGKVSEAVATLDQVRKTAPRSLAADAAYNLGEALYRGQDYENAAKAFRESLRLAPGDADASWNYELAVRRAIEKKKQEQEKKKEQENQKQSKPQDQKQPGQPSPSPTPKPDPGKEQKEKEDREFEQKAKMPREKAEQLLSAISQSDLEEQKKKIAEQKARRRVARDW